MAENTGARRGVSIALTCRAFGVSETCYRYSRKLKDQNKEIADLLVGLTDDLFPSLHHARVTLAVSGACSCPIPPCGSSLIQHVSRNPHHLPHFADRVSRNADRVNILS
jgi:hypothetical protein